LVLDAQAHTGSHARLLEVLNTRQVSVLNLPTAYWHELVLYLRDSGAALPSHLHTVVIGGEAASATRLADWCTLNTSHIRLLNTYGSTETTLVTHTAELHGPRATHARGSAHRVPIGKPLPHIKQHITEEGELWIGGPSLSMGYLDRADLTAERFVMCDVGDGLQRWYRTGDRVSELADQTLVHAGRLDRQIKVRGVQVDPAEIEAEIGKHRHVAAVAVVGVMQSERMVVVAYVLPHPHAGAATLGRRLTDELRQRLPAHLVPTRVQVVEQLAYTASGKLDRAASHRMHSQTPTVAASVRRAPTLPQLSQVTL
jgi:acyl-coenzyme A synthetase/AMP-(fatty) acid ligase